MSAELIAILSMGLGTFVMILGLFAWFLRSEIVELRGEVWDLRRRVAHAEGLLERSREAISVRG